VELGAELKGTDTSLGDLPMLSSSEIPILPKPVLLFGMHEGWMIIWDTAGLMQKNVYETYWLSGSVLATVGVYFGG
jgi:hypothetical protein